MLKACYFRLSLTFDNLVLTVVPMPLKTKIATTEISARISAYSTKL